MGFRARSAQEMYRYAFRLDQPERSLSDGFGWTILLLGDSTDRTRDFLLRHGVELSIKTAHRIRFAFFSGISESETERFAQDLNYGRYSARSFLDLLQRGLRRKPWRDGPLDWEGEYLHNLRPSVFAPFTDAREIHVHFHEAYRLLESAIPGAQAAAWLAQEKLRIGRHLPCLLLFTDLGAPRYHVLPFGQHSVTEVYERVRSWIDAYYEVNAETLSRWSSIEEQIQSLAQEARISLQTIRNWAAKRQADWVVLSVLAECARIARQRPDAAPEELRALTALQQPLPRQVGRELHSLRQRLNDLEIREKKAAALTRAASLLAESTDVEHIVRILRNLYTEERYNMSTATLEKLKNASILWTEALPVSARQELFRWWRSPGGSFFSKRSFRRARYELREFYETQQREGESYAEHRRRDYDAFWAAVGSRPLSADSEETADYVIAQLAVHYAVSPTEPTWSAATERMRRHVTDGVAQAQRSAPAWVLSLDPSASLSDCLFVGPTGDQRALGDFLASSPVLAAAVDALDGPDWLRRTSEKRLADCLAHRDIIAQSLGEEARRQVTMSESRSALSREITSQLQRAHAEFAAEVERNTPEKLREDSGIVRIKENLELAEGLRSALTEYDDAVRNLVYPHVNDPWVIALPIPAHLRSNISTAADVEPHDPVATRRETLRTLRINAQETLARHEEASQDGTRWAPDVRFADVLTAVLAEPRAQAVLRPFPGGTLREKAARAVREQRAGELLGTLSRQELALLAAHARPAESPAPRLSTTGTETPAGVLSLFGLRRPPRVFISYAHEDDGGAHTESVRAFWLLLRSLGVNARLDLAAAEEPQDWALWTLHEYQSADYVLVVASPAYRRRAEGSETPGTGRGVIWEAGLIRSEVYARPGSWHRRILRVVLPGGSPEDLPAYLGGHATTHYTVGPLTPQGAEKLLRYITDQPYEIELPLGPTPHLPPRSPN
ncbi:SEFIR domain-containing protein [Streptomyces sp. NPDC058964]|uniref:SEFIR domain-containing protein n=1 Tax=Streptomyces sp. NPDC058964 TaxID=3346681 RepID=UPI0036C9B99E